MVDLVAISEDSDDLTTLYKNLDGDDLFVSARLINKKQIATGGRAKTQAHLILTLVISNGEARP